MRPIALALLPLLAACLGKLEDTAGTCTPQAWYRDGDGDGHGSTLESVEDCEAPEGFVADASDCDDSQPAVYPGAAEVCDGLDNDCDEEEDLDDPDVTDAVEVWSDEDGDGYGDPATLTRTCSPRADQVEQADDCDDDDADVHPGAEERCNEADDDCDDRVDEDGAVDAPTWYRDRDGDSFGGSDETVAACARPDGYGPEPSDCDDTRFDVNPGADEVCNLVDDDCDTAIDEPDAVDATSWYRDADSDGYGLTDVSEVACEVPFGYTALAGDCDDEDPLVNPKVMESCNDTDDDCDGTVDDPDELLLVSWYADTDGDGQGNPAAEVKDCAQPSGYVAIGTDCDDGNNEINTDATELCNGADDDCDGLVDVNAVDAVSTWLDEDGDGFGADGTEETGCDFGGRVSNADDCDDTNIAINPAGVETCNGADDDCDDEVDEDALVTWFTDLDEDGYGDPYAPASGCTAPAGAVNNDDDCNDSFADVYPGAPEVCDSVDNDCDGITDDEAMDAITWYADRDHDGFGTPISYIVSCVQPTEFIEDASDCDDEAADVYPGADEICDGSDNDCDGLSDTDDADLVDGTTWFVDADGDGYGDPAYSVEGCLPDTGTWSLRSDDCDDSRDVVHPDAVEECFNGIDENCDGDCDECWSEGEYSLGEASSLLAGSVAGLGMAALATCGDATGDGIDDLFVGLPGYSTGSWGDQGAVIRIDGPVETGATVLTVDASATLTGDVSGDGLGATLACAEDLMGTGTVHVLAGSLATGTSAAVWLVPTYFGGTSTVSLGSSASLAGSTLGDDVGHTTFPVGDVDGDGNGDLLVSGTGGGRVLLVWGPVPGGANSLDGTDVTVAVLSGTAADEPGDQTSARVGDMNGDGLDDVAVATPGSDLGGSKAGGVYLIAGDPSRAATGTSLVGLAEASWAGAADGDRLGSTTNLGADLDGDGYSDLLTTAPAAGTRKGAVYVLPGGSPVISGSAADALTVLEGSVTGQSLGQQVVVLDLTDDGELDVVVGDLSDSAGLDAGGVTAIPGPLPTGTWDVADLAAARFLGERAGDEAYRVVSAGDPDGDGAEDLGVLSALNDPAGTADAGIAYLFYACGW